MDLLAERLLVRSVQRRRVGTGGAGAARTHDATHLADARFGIKTLSDADIKTLVSWVDGGSVEGDAKDGPPAIEFPQGWNIKPDMVIEFPLDVNLDAPRRIAQIDEVTLAHVAMRCNPTGRAQDRTFGKFLAHFANASAGSKGVAERSHLERRRRRAQRV